MNKPIIFISHITEEKDLALNLKEFIEKNFLGMVEVFVSSDENSIELGHEWLNNITNNLRNCNIELILCSPTSIRRPWINFEAGAGWVRENCRVIPICHSNMEPQNLPLPLNLLQGMELNNKLKIQELVKIIANVLGCNTPNLTVDEFISNVKSFEEKYTYWNIINEDFKNFFQAFCNYGFFQNGEKYSQMQNSLYAYKQFLNYLYDKYSIEIKMYISNYDYRIYEEFEKLHILKSITLGMGKADGGNYTHFRLEKLENFDKIVNNPNFIYCIKEYTNAK